MATPYGIQATFALGSPRGPTKPFNLTASDVAGEYWLFPSGASELALNAQNDVYLIDANVSSSAGTTKNAEFFVGGQSTGFTLLLANSTGTIQDRPFKLCPLKIPKGMAFKVIQRA